MAILKSPPSYGQRSAGTWLEEAKRGIVLLPNFQRSFVWKPGLTADYLKALFEGRPTGVFLILEADAEDLPFTCRSLHHLESASSGPPTPNTDGRADLVLDGQQRLTALWGALKGADPQRRYIVRVASFADIEPDVKEVFWKSHSWSNPIKMYRENCVPIDLLGADDAGGLRRWCEEAAAEDWASLFDVVSTIRSRLVDKSVLRYCQLKEDTHRDIAIDIFINVNKSAVKLKEVDIAVALAEADHNVDLRTRVQRYVERSAEAPYYFSKAPKQFIPEVAEWMLKVGCLLVDGSSGTPGLAPGVMRYPSAVKRLCEGDDQDATTDANARLDQLEADLDSALAFVAARGGATKAFLAGWPPVHVIAALQSEVRAAGPDVATEVKKLLSAYFWRGVLTERYAATAASRLLEDFRALKAYIRVLVEWKRGGVAPSDSPPAPIFDDEYYPLPSKTKLMRAKAGASRLSRGIMAVIMQSNPPDWITGERLDSARVRELGSRLEGRQVFPDSLFGDSFDCKLILNVVRLRRNRPPLKACDPSELLTELSQIQPGVGDLEFRSRMHGHGVDWATLKKDGNDAHRYRQFLEARAHWVKSAAHERAKYTPPTP